MYCLKADIYVRDILFRWEGDANHYIVGRFRELSEVVLLNNGLGILIYWVMRNCVIRKYNLMVFRAGCLIVTNLNMKDCLRNIQ